MECINFDYVFLLQSENAYICYVIVFDKQVTLYSRLFVFFRLMSDERPECNVNWLKNPSLIFIVRLLFIYAFTLHRALLHLIEATNVARRSWTAGGRQSTKSERPSRTSVLRFVDGKGHIRYPASRGRSIFLDKTYLGRIEGPLLAG